MTVESCWRNVLVLAFSVEMLSLFPELLQFMNGNTSGVHLNTIMPAESGLFRHSTLTEPLMYNSVKLRDCMAWNVICDDAEKYEQIIPIITKVTCMLKDL